MLEEGQIIFARKPEKKVAFKMDFKAFRQPDNRVGILGNKMTEAKYIIWGDASFKLDSL